MARDQKRQRRLRGLVKTPTGIRGLDEITGGGLPAGRPTIVAGGPGSGKSVLGIEFLVRGATHFQEPGVLVTFEETAEELAQNVASLGYDLNKLCRQRQLWIDEVVIDREEWAESGEYDLEGLFVRLAHAIRSIGARRVVLDTVEVLLETFPPVLMRAELRRLFRWLKSENVTVLVTAEEGKSSLTRHNVEEYVSDCVIQLRHNVKDLITTRTMRIVKYRGTAHETNEYPFAIDEGGVWISPITSLKLDYKVTARRISSGIPEFDQMLGGKGFYQESTVLVSGTVGVGKTTLAAHFIHNACREGKDCLFVSFEESPSELMRNMKSAGMDLSKWSKRLHFHSLRPTVEGLESHLTTILRLVAQIRPQVVVLDPVTSLLAVGSPARVKSMLTRLTTRLKAAGATVMATSLLPHESAASHYEIASLMDAWIDLRALENAGQTRRVLLIRKSRGMAHSGQIREFEITRKGIRLLDGRENIPPRRD